MVLESDNESTPTQQLRNGTMCEDCVKQRTSPSPGTLVFIIAAFERRVDVVLYPSALHNIYCNPTARIRPSACAASTGNGVFRPEFGPASLFHDGERKASDDA